MRKITYAVDTDSPHHLEHILMSSKKAHYGAVPMGRCAALYRFNQLVTVFVLTPSQEKKVRARKGKINITEKAIERGSLCRR